MKFQKMLCIQLCFCLAVDFDPAFDTSLRTKKRSGKNLLEAIQHGSKSFTIHQPGYTKTKIPHLKLKTGVSQMCRLHVNPTGFNTQKSTNRSFTSNPKGPRSVPSPKWLQQFLHPNPLGRIPKSPRHVSLCPWRCDVPSAPEFWWKVENFIGALFLVGKRGIWGAGPLYSDESPQDWGSSLADYRNSHPWPCVTSMEETWTQAAGMFSLKGSC